MKVYDPELIGYGVDYWYIDALGPDINGKVAIVDDIFCVNPHDRDKGGQREIDLLQPEAERIKSWERIKNHYRIQERKAMRFGSIQRPVNISTLFEVLTILTHWGIVFQN